jgi:hypothetical protein
MSLERRLAENILRLGIKNLNNNATENIVNKINNITRIDYYTDYTYLDQYGSLIERKGSILEQNPDDIVDPADTEDNEGPNPTNSRQTKLRAAGSKIRQSIQSTPLMSKWINWRQKRFAKRNGLPAMAVLIENDSPEVQNTPGYRDVINLLYSKRTRDVASIMYWYGTPALGGDANPEDQSNMSTLLANLSKFNGIEFVSGYEGDTPVKLELTGFITALQRLYDQQIYLTVNDLLEIFPKEDNDTLSAIFNVALTGQFEGTKYNLLDANLRTAFAKAWTISNDNRSFNPMLSKDLQRLQNFSSKLTIAASGKPGTKKTGEIDSIATYEVAITDADKIGIITGVQSELARDKQDNPKLTINDYTSFLIAPNALEITSNVKKGTESVAGVGEVEVTAVYYSFPDNPNDAAQANVIFGNNDNITTWNNTQTFEAAFAKQVDAIVKSGNKIYRVEYNAGAKSSKVGTTKYGGTSTAAKTAGNVKLCQERANAITSGLGPIITKLLPDAAAQATAANLHPNVGPGWYSYEPAGYQYGALYEAYRQKNKAATPQVFYMGRSNEKMYADLQAGGATATQQQIEAEYQQVYSQFRGTYAGYTIYSYKLTETPAEPAAEPEYEIRQAGSWYYELDYTVLTGKDIIDSTGLWITSRWKQFKRKIKKIDLGKLKLTMGGGTGNTNMNGLCDAYGKLAGTKGR